MCDETCLSANLRGSSVPLPVFGVGLGAGVATRANHAATALRPEGRKGWGAAHYVTGVVLEEAWGRILRYAAERDEMWY